MLWPLFFDDDNWRSMFHTLCIYYHALNVVVRQWQVTEHVLYTRDILPCMLHTLGIYYNALTVFQETMTTEGSCFIPKGWITMLWPLSWIDYNWRSMFYTWGIYCHALTVVMSWWQLTEDVSHMSDILLCSDRCHVTMTTDGAFSFMRDILPCSDRCHEMMTTDGAWLIL